MPMSFAEGFFLLAFWAPPLAVIICAGMLAAGPVRLRSSRAEVGRVHAAAA